MIRLALLLLFVFSSIQSASATRPAPFDPSKYQVEKIKVGVVVDGNGQGQDVAELEKVIADKIQNYFQEKLVQAGVDIPIEVEMYFPGSCLFRGAKLERYRPLSESGVVEKLPKHYISLFFNVSQDDQEKTKLLTAKLCWNQMATRLDFPESWPAIHKRDEYLADCSFEGSDHIADYVLCRQRYFLDAIIWGLEQQKEND